MGKCCRDGYVAINIIRSLFCDGYIVIAMPRYERPRVAQHFVLAAL